MSDKSVTTINSAAEVDAIPDIIVDGIPESEIWAMAPSFPAERLHFRYTDDFDLKAFSDYLPFKSWVRERSDGQGRLWVPVGKGEKARALLLKWLDRHGITAPTHLRVEHKGVVFRDLSLIPDNQQYLVDGIIVQTTEWMVRLPKFYNIREKIMADLDLVEADDVKSMLAMFIMDLIDQYDEGRSAKAHGNLNFRAFAWGKVKHWPQTLIRQDRGRGLVDSQMHINRAISAFEAENHRAPSRAELAARLDMSVTELLERQRVSETFIALSRAAGLTESFDGDDDSSGRQFVVADPYADTEAVAMVRAQHAALARTIIEAARTTDKNDENRTYIDPLTLAVVYKHTWEEQGKGAVAEALGINAGRVNKALDRVSAAALASRDRF